MDDGPPAFISLLLVGAILLQGLFVLFVAAIQRSSLAQIQKRVIEGRWGARAAEVILSKQELYLLACQVGRFVSAALFGGVLVVLIQRGQAHWVEDNRALELGIGLMVVVAPLIVVLLIIQLGRAWAYAQPERVLSLTAWPGLAIVRFLMPLVAFVERSSRPLLRLFRLNPPQEETVAISAEELSQLVERSSAAGAIEEEELEMIQSIFDLSETVVREVMTPRNDIVSVATDMALPEIIELLQSEGFSRMLVIENDLDQVKGVLNVKDLLPFIGRPVEEFSLDAVIREAHTIPSTTRIDQAFKDFRRNAAHLAVVLDEHGGVDGVVTMEDLIEEIVGDIFDEYDSPEEEIEVRATLSGDLIVDGSTPIDDLNEEYQFEFPEGEYDTIAGFVIHQLGRIPTMGEQCYYDGVSIKVEEVEQNRVTQVRISRM